MEKISFSETLGVTTRPHGITSKNREIFPYLDMIIPLRLYIEFGCILFGLLQFAVILSLLLTTSVVLHRVQPFNLNCNIKACRPLALYTAVLQRQMHFLIRKLFCVICNIVSL